MSKSVAELAKKYYPKYWDLKRMNTLLKSGKLTDDEYKMIMYGEIPDPSPANLSSDNETDANN